MLDDSVHTAYYPCARLRNLLRMLVSKSWSECGWRNIATGFTCVGFSPEHWLRQKLFPEMKSLPPVQGMMLSEVFPLTGTHPLSPQSSWRTFDFVCFVPMIHK